MEETFKGAVIDEQTHEDDLHDFTVIPNPKPPESEMVNSLPNSVARLEKFYDFEDKFKKRSIAKLIVPHYITKKLI
jgi:hypothetical protein